MSTLEHVILPGDAYSAVFYKSFADNQGAVFALFSFPETAANDPFFKIARERLERWAARPMPEASLLEAAFEHIIQTINEALVGTEKNIQPNPFQCAVGAISGSLLVMTGVGDFRGTLVRREKQGTFHVYELLNGLREQASDDRSFGALVSGELRPDDTLGLALRETIADIEETFWKQTLATRSPQESEISLKHRLQTNPRPGAIIIIRTAHSSAAPAIVKTPSIPSHTSSKDSIRALRNTQHATETTLNSRGFGFFTILKKSSKALWRIIRNSYARIKNRSRPTPSTTALPKAKNQFLTAWQAITGIALSVVGFFGLLLHIAQHPFRIFRNRKQVFADFSAGTNRIRDFLVARFNVLPRLSKFLLIGALVFLVLFTQSLLYMHYRKTALAADQGYEEAVTVIAQIRDQAEGMVIYHDETAARNLLTKALSQIDALPQDSRSRRKTASELRDQIMGDLKKLRHEIQITPAMMTTLEQPPETTAFDHWLVLYDDPTGANPIISITGTEKRALVVYRDNSLAVIEKDGTVTAISTTEKINDAEFFGDRLYLLSASAPQVYRSRLNQTTINTPTPWITDDAQLAKNGRSIAVDGSLYLLHPTEIIKLFTGHQEAWTPYIDPPLEDANRIWTTDEAQNIYVLESSHRRILVLSKTGSLIAQYLFPDGSNIRDFAVDEKNNTLSVLDDTSIKHISLSITP